MVRMARQVCSPAIRCTTTPTPAGACSGSSYGVPAMVEEGLPPTRRC